MSDQQYQVWMMLSDRLRGIENASAHSQQDTVRRIVEIRDITTDTARKVDGIITWSLRILWAGAILLVNGGHLAMDDLVALVKGIIP